MLIVHKKRNVFHERKQKVYGPLMMVELLFDLSFSIAFAILYYFFTLNDIFLGPFCHGSLLNFSIWNGVVNAISGVYSGLTLIILAILFCNLSIKTWLIVMEILFWIRYLIHIPALFIYFGLIYSVVEEANCGLLNILNIIYITLYSFTLFLAWIFSFREPDKRFIDSIDDEEEKLIFRRRR